MAWHRFYVDAWSQQILLTGKMLTSSTKAICLPETAINGYSLEAAGRVEDTLIHDSPGNAS
jgi:hypothetical protein